MVIGRLGPFTRRFLCAPRWHTLHSAAASDTIKLAAGQERPTGPRFPRTPAPQHDEETDEPHGPIVGTAACEERGQGAHRKRSPLMNNSSSESIASALKRFGERIPSPSPLPSSLRHLAPVLCVDFSGERRTGRCHLFTDCRPFHRASDFVTLCDGPGPGVALHFRRLPFKAARFYALTRARRRHSLSLFH